FNTYDNQPINGFNYYYVKAFTLDGDVIISDTKSIRWTNEVNASLYPNPSYNNNLQIQLDNSEISQVNIRITTITGQVVYQDNLSLNNGYLAINASELNAGTYTVNVADENQTYLTKQWILVK
ncbi:MAG: T9SS type A sorting domain-containing protein, partial [Bacteroidota bacterium]